MGRFVDITGQQFGRLKVVRRSDTRKRLHVVWVCKCECGAEREVTGNALRTGHTQSCGCLAKDNRLAAVTHHGYAQRGNVTKVYRAWQNMKSRCHNPNSTYYEYYGGRGIKVCEAWRADFEAFLRDMGEPPTPAHTLDRIDSDGDYTPDNTRWATRRTQSNNRNNVIMITLQGVTKPLTEWCDEYNVKYKRARYLLKIGRNPEAVFTKEK